jgi:hypothetical protein
MFDPYMQAYWSGGWPGVEMLAPAPQPIKHHTLRQRLLRAMESVKDDMPLLDYINLETKGLMERQISKLVPVIEEWHEEQNAKADVPASRT